MAGGALTWKIDDKAMRRALRHMLNSVEDTTPIMRAFADDQAGRVRDRFQDQVDPDGNPWTPLAAVTIAKRQKDGFVPISILRASGALAGSINWKADRTGFTVGTDGAVEDYASIHQEGGDAGRNLSVSIPARPYIGFGEADLDIMEEDLLDWLETDRA